MVHVGRNIFHINNLCNTDLNPIEKCFNEIKMKFKEERYAPHLKRNIGVAVYDAVDEIPLSNMIGYYRSTQCINI